MNLVKKFVPFLGSNKLIRHWRVCRWPFERLVGLDLVRYRVVRVESQLAYTIANEVLSPYATIQRRQDQVFSKGGITPGGGNEREKRGSEAASPGSRTHAPRSQEMAQLLRSSVPQVHSEDKFPVQWSIRDRTWREGEQDELNEAKLEQGQTPGPFDIQDLRRHVAEHDIRRLRDFAVKHGRSILIGHGLSTKGVLYEIASVSHRDTEIHILKVRESHELEVLPGSRYVRAMTWDLVLDYDHRSYSLRDEAKRRQKVARAEASAPLPLTPQDRKVIDAMWDKGPMRMTDIEKASGLPHSTFVQRFRALQRREKGEWIFKVSEGYYVVNQYNKRDWAK
jgi:hypothetical protein